MRLLLFAFLLLFAASRAVALAPAPPQPPGFSGMTSDLAAMPSDQRWQAAHAAFERGDFQEAQSLYTQLAHGGYAAPAVWFNAGTSAYRGGDVGRAVLYYHRALRLDPEYERARSSLAVISPATNEVRSSFGGEFLTGLFQWTRPLWWVLAAEIFFLAGCLAIARAIAASDRDQRHHWLAVLAWSLVLALVAGGGAWANFTVLKGNAEAVVVADKAVTRSEPRAEATAQLELPAGTVLDMTEEPSRGFVRVKLMDGRVGYISTDQIEAI